MLTGTLRLQPTDPLSAARHAAGCRGLSRGAAARVPSVRVTQTHRHTHTLTRTHPRGPIRARLCLTERSLTVWMEALCDRGGGGSGGSSARCVAGEKAPYLGEAEQRERQQQPGHHGASGSDSLRQVRLLLPLIRTMATRLLRRRLLCDRRATSVPPSSSSSPSPSSSPPSVHHRRLRFLVDSG